MSRILYYDCFAGISGDMNLAALLDLGVPLDYIRENLAKLGIGEEYELQAEPTLKSGISGTKLTVHVHHHHHDDHGHGHGHHHHRHFSDIREMIEASSLSDYVKQHSIAVFKVLAEAEGKVHGTEPDKVHFHEVGAVDSIVDIVASIIAIEYLKIDKLYSSTVELGSGTVHCAHGVMPVPAPATMLLSQSFPSSIGGTDHEATTPTGAAFLAAMADGFDPRLAGRCKAVGIGIGHRDSDKLPNILRVNLYETEDAKPDETDPATVSACAIVEANLDDMSPEHVSYLTDKLSEAGAMDVWQESIVMKKSRLGVKVCALGSMEKTPQLRHAFFVHSTTWGLRQIPLAKYELDREIVTGKTPYGDVRVKKACPQGMPIKEKAEFEDCRQLSEEHGVTIQQITDTIQREY